VGSGRDIVIDAGVKIGSGVRVGVGLGTSDGSGIGVAMINGAVV